MTPPRNARSRPKVARRGQGIDSQDLRTKKRLADQVRGILRQKRWTQKEAARILGLTQPKVSALTKGELEQFSSARLMKCLTTLSKDIEIVVGAKSPIRESGEVKVTEKRRAATHATLANATDMVSWSDRTESRTELPRLIRRLCNSSPGIRQAFFRTAEGTDLKGWDGITVSDQDRGLVPVGISGWELSVRRDARTKADEDYERRTKNPGGMDPATTTFVFATTRRFPEKTKWAQRRAKEGVWKNVLVLDADDLEGWLELTPSVHVWFSHVLGKRPDDASDVETWWNDWSQATQPPISSAFLLAGRGGAAKALESDLRGDIPALSVRAESRNEALAVVCAVLMRAENAGLASRAVVVDSAAALDRLAATDGQLILIPTFDSIETVSRAVRSGHKIVVPIGKEQSSSDVIEIPRLNVDEAAASLVKGSLTSGEDDLPNKASDREDEARELATFARRSMDAFRRSISIRRELQTPIWATPSNAHDTLPFIMVGAWNESNKNDIAAIAELGLMEDPGRLPPLASRLSRLDDPPFRSSGRTWYLTSQEDAWHLMAPALTQGDLERFRDLAARVLSEADQRLEEPDEKRWLGPAAFQYSPELREGVAKTLAMMGAQGSREVAGTRLDRWAELIVRDLLEKANKDWRVWHALAKLLTILAEAAPAVFLEEVEEGLRGSVPIRRLFDDKKDSIFHSSAHPHLLWALERLTWSPEYLSRAARVLARLVEIDPGGQTSNRPRATLRETFLLWRPQTAATWVEQLQVLKSLLDRVPDVGWQLHSDLLPRAHDSVMNRTKPQWRDWAPDADIRLTYGEIHRRIDDVVTQMLAAVGSDGQRWVDLVNSLPHVTRESHSAIVGALSKLDVATVAQEHRALIWNALREVIGQHRSFPEADWAMPKADVDALDEVRARFEPTDSLLRFGWLFANQVRLPGVREHDWNEEERAVNDERLKAVEAIRSTDGESAIERIAGLVSNPITLGRAAASSDTIQSQDRWLSRHLTSRDPKLHAFAHGIAVGRLITIGQDWVIEKAGSPDLSVEQRAHLLTLLPHGKETWALAATSEEINREYWQRAYPHFRGSLQETEYGARQLLKYGRAYAAAETVAFLLKGPEQPTGQLIADVLEAAIRQEKPDHDDGSVGYWIGELLKVLADSKDVEESRIASIEWAFAPGLSHDRPPIVLHRELARNPGFFIELIKLIFRADNEEKAPAPSQQERSKASAAWHVINSWHSLPRSNANGVDPVGLKNWVNEALEGGQAAHRDDITAQYVGTALSHGPEGSDGVWPHEAVREVIESVANREVERGFELGVFNSRGVVTRSLNDGGRQEHALADNYARAAKRLALRWPRTAEILRRLEATYRDQARNEDRQSDRIEDGIW
jgi:predicted XRE-type DNA-binding protein